MVKKIRLIDTEPASEEPKETTKVVNADAFTGADPMTRQQGDELLKYAEQIDWKLWEILKIMKGETDEE